MIRDTSCSSWRIPGVTWDGKVISRRRIHNIGRRKWRKPVTMIQTMPVSLIMVRFVWTKSSIHGCFTSRWSSFENDSILKLFSYYCRSILDRFWIRSEFLWCYLYQLESRFISLHNLHAPVSLNIIFISFLKCATLMKLLNYYT